MRNLRTEDEIIANWKGDIDQPVVSICCITYNHEPYVEDALEGFLNQETNFPFEILIHDDASTDRTAAIIREYEVKYPRLIKPIYQTENQYSKGLKMNPTFNFPRSKGQYIALCEGDDYWIASEKLQTQVQLMREYPDVNISFHPAYKVDGFELKKNKIFANHSKDVKIFTPKEVILGGGGFMPTQSLMIKSELLKNLPDWFFNNAPVGDYYLQIISSIDNGALYFPMILGIYRTNITGSWSSERKLEIEKFFLALDKLDSWFSNKYSKEVSIAKKHLYYSAGRLELAKGNFLESRIFILKSLWVRDLVFKAVVIYFLSFLKLRV